MGTLNNFIFFTLIINADIVFKFKITLTILIYGYRNTVTNLSLNGKLLSLIHEKILLFRLHIPGSNNGIVLLIVFSGNGNKTANPKRNFLSGNISSNNFQRTR